MAMLEVFADVRCPFTHVGLRRLVERRDARGAGATLHVRAWPLELVNGAPLDVNLVDEEVQALKAQVTPDLFKVLPGELRVDGVAGAGTDGGGLRPRGLDGRGGGAGVAVGLLRGRS